MTPSESLQEVIAAWDRQIDEIGLRAVESMYLENIGCERVRRATIHGN